MTLPSDAQSLQGTILDCFVEFTPVYYSRNLDFDVSSFVFVVYSNEIKTSEIKNIVHRIFNHHLDSIDVVSGFNRIQYTILLTPALSSSILLVLSQMGDHWRVIREETANNPTFYASVIRYVFCDVMERTAINVYSVKLDVALCHLPMDTLSVLGNEFVFCVLSIAVEGCIVLQSVGFTDMFLKLSCVLHCCVWTEGISNTFNTNATIFMKLRNKFASDILSVFEKKVHSPTTASAKIVQDPGVRSFYNIVAEAMGYNFAELMQRVVLTPVPSSNGVALLWLPNNASKPLIVDVRRVMRTITRRESPNSISLMDCQESAR